MFAHQTLLAVVAVLIALPCDSQGRDLMDDGPAKRLLDDDGPAKRLLYDDGPAKRLLDDTYNTITSQLATLTKKVQDLEAQVALQSPPPIAFQAYLTTTITGGQKQVIVYDQVTTNIGNAYKTHHGNFIAPVNGTYQFALYACSDGPNIIVLDLMRNGNTVGRVLSGDASYTECTSRVILLYLVVGDDVYVEQGTAGNQLAVHSTYGEPSFSGVLIQAH